MTVTRSGAPRPRGAGPGPEWVSLLEAAPELGRDLGVREHRQALGGLRVRVIPFERAPAEQANNPRLLGFLVLEGMLVREIEIAGAATAELLGVGDFLRPWETAGRHEQHLPVELHWRPLQSTRLAVIDIPLVQHAATWPPVTGRLLAQNVRRTHELAVLLTVTRLPRVDDRLVLLFDSLGERWGRPDGEDVGLPLRLSHVLIAHLAGAHRPSVTLGLRRLTQQGMLSRAPDGSWTLHPPLREARDRLLERSSGAGPPRAPSG